MRITFDPRDGLCAQVGFGGDLWHPEKGERANEAKRICTRCPIQPACLEYALPLTELDGVWGGLSERERAKLRSQRRKDAAA